VVHQCFDISKLIHKVINGKRVVIDPITGRTLNLLKLIVHIPTWHRISRDLRGPADAWEANIFEFPENAILGACIHQICIKTNLSQLDEWGLNLWDLEEDEPEEFGM
jgi:hypothetical protein